MQPLPSCAYIGARPHSLIITVYDRRTLRGYEQLIDVTKEEILNKFKYPDIDTFIRQMEKDEYRPYYYIGSYRFLFDLDREEE